MFRVKDGLRVGTTNVIDASGNLLTTAANAALLGGQPAAYFYSPGNLVFGSGLTLSGGTLSLANSGVTAGTVGSSTSIPIISYNSKGQITTVSSADIGSSAAKNIGTSGNTVPVLDGMNTWSGIQTFNSNIVMAASIIPAADNLYSLGSATKRWKDIFVSANTVYLGNSTILSGTSIVVDAGGTSNTLADIPTIQASKLVAKPYVYNPGGGPITVRPSIEFQVGSESYPISLNTSTFEFSLDAQGNYGTGSLVAKKITLNANTTALEVTGNFNHNGNYLNTQGSTFRFDGDVTLGYDGARSLTVKSNTVVTGGFSTQGTTNLGDGNDTVTVNAGSNNFVVTAGNFSISPSGNMVVFGNLTVSGSTTSINSNEVNIGDAVLLLNADIAPGATPSEDAGIQIARGAENAARWLWVENGDYWSPMGADIKNIGAISASSLNATTLTATNGTVTALSSNSVSTLAIQTGNATITGATTGNTASFNSVTVAGTVSTNGLSATSVSTGSLTATGSSNLAAVSATAITGTSVSVTGQATANTVVANVVTTPSLDATVATVGTLNTTNLNVTNTTNLNADLLDGQHGSYYSNAANLTNTVPASVLPATGVAAGTFGSIDYTDISNPKPRVTTFAVDTKGRILSASDTLLGTAAFADTAGAAFNAASGHVLPFADQTTVTWAGAHTFGKKLTTAAATISGGAFFNIPHGSQPSTPTNGDLWSTTGGLFMQVNGVAKTVLFNGDSFNATSASKWNTARTITVSGDVDVTISSLDGSANVFSTATLATVNSNVGTFGSAVAIPVLTVNAKGLVTAASTVAISLGTAGQANTGTSGHTIPYLDGSNTWSASQTFQDVTVAGNLVVTGTTTTIEAATLEVADPIITVGKNNVSAAISYTGLRMERGFDDAYLVWDETQGMFTAQTASSENLDNRDYAPFKASVFVSAIGNGAPPMYINSTYLVANLNADMVDGAHIGTSGAAIPLMSSNNTWSGKQTFNSVQFGPVSFGLTGLLRGAGTGNTTAVTGTAKILPKWTNDSSSLTDSLIYDDGDQVRIGTTQNSVGNASRVYIFGGTNGANVDIRGNSAELGGGDQSTITLQSGDFDTTTKHVALQYVNHGFGTTLGYANTQLAHLSFNSDKALIWTATNVPLVFGTNGSARVQVANTGQFAPITNDGSALGKAGTAWSDLYLAGGGVIDFANGDVTLSHSTGTLNVSTSITAPSVIGINVVRTAGANQGNIDIAASGNQTNTGYLNFYTKDGLRTGYIGYADNNWNYLSAENGRGWRVAGTTLLDNDVTVAGQLNVNTAGVFKNSLYVHNYSGAAASLNIRPYNTGVYSVLTLDGTDGAPGLTVTGTTNNAYFDADNLHFRLAAGGTDRLTINSGAVTINGASNTLALLNLIPNGSALYSQIAMRGEGDTNGLNITGATGNGYIDSDNLHIRASNGAERLTVSSSGVYIPYRLGVGTDNPAYTAVFSKAGAEGIEFGAGFASNASFIQFFDRSKGQYNTGYLYGSDFLWNNGSQQLAYLSSAGLIVEGSITAKGGLIRATGATPYLSLAPTAWSGESYVQAGVNDSVGGAGDNLAFYVPSGKSITQFIAGAGVITKTSAAQVDFNRSIVINSNSLPELRFTNPSTWGTTYMFAAGEQNGNGAGDYQVYQVPTGKGHSFVVGTSGSHLRVVTGKVQTGSGVNFHRSDFHTGHLVGGHNTVGDSAGKTNPIYSIGNGYTPGESVLGGMYGIGYSHGESSSFLTSRGYEGWGMYVSAAGSPSIFLGADSGVVTSEGGFKTSTGKISLGSTTRQMIDLWSNGYGIGVQTSTAYLRTGGQFAVYQGGVHAEGALDAGGGNLLLSAGQGGAVVPGTMTAWNTSTQGTTKGSLHLGYANDVNGTGPAITFQTSSGGYGPQAGIYTTMSGGYGSRMYISTTNSYATGPQTAISINEHGSVNIDKGVLTVAGSTVHHAGNLPVSTLARDGTENGFTRLAYVGGGTFIETAPSVTGALQIRLPVGFENVMLSFDIDVFNYDMPNLRRTISVSGYTYAGTNAWEAADAKVVSGASAPMSVRFGKDSGGQPCVWIGDTTTVWSYPKLVIRNVMLSHAFVERFRWESGWQITRVTAYGTVTVANTGRLNATTLEGYKTDALASASSIVLRDQSGSILGRDLYASRGDGTGVLYLNSGGSRYLYFDGGSYVLPGSPLQVQGSQVWTDGNAKTSSEHITFSNIRKGVVGVYDAANTQAVWAMGPAYTLSGGGTTDYGNHYGLAWSYNPDYGGAGNNPQSKPGLNHQLLLQMAGVTYTAIGDGIWTNGSIKTRGGSIFFTDSNKCLQWDGSWFVHSDKGLFDGARPIYLRSDTGSMYIKGDAGGWDMGYRFYGSSSSTVGSFGATGSGDAASFVYAGMNDFTSANNLRIYPTTLQWGSNTIWHAGNDGSGSGLDADLLDGRGGNGYISTDNAFGEQVITGAKYFAVPLGSTLTGANGGVIPLMAASYNGDPAFMSFHRVGYYAVNFGIDTDNQLKVGGWSMGDAKYAIWHEGNDGPDSGLYASHTRRIDVVDTRFVVDAPNVLSGHAVVADFKAESIAGSPPVVAGNGYAHILTMCGWDNGSANFGGGGKASQVSFGDGLAVRQASDGTTWGPWRKLWHDGNDGSGSGLDADVVRGIAPSASAIANTLVQRDGNGYAYFNYINTNVGETENGTINSMFVSNGDGWLRKASKEHVVSQLPEFTASTKGMVPASGGGTANFLRADGSWAAAGGGDWELIGTVSASGYTTTFANIPQTYKDIRLEGDNLGYDDGSGQPNSGPGQVSMSVSPNGNGTNSSGYVNVGVNTSSNGPIKYYGYFDLMNYKRSIGGIVGGFSYVQDYQAAGAYMTTLYSSGMGLWRMPTGSIQWLSISTGGVALQGTWKLFGRK